MNDPRHAVVGCAFLTCSLLGAAPLATAQPLEPAATGAPPAAAEATPPPPAAPPACVPACRSGFLCLQGACVSACNPACPSDQVCTSAGSCVASAPPAFAPPAFAPPSAPMLAPAPALPTPAESRAARDETRQSLRITLHGLMTVSAVASKLVAVGFTGALGLRQNLAPQAGIQLRGGASIAGLFSAHDTSTDTKPAATTMTDTYAEVVPYLGPLGRFYFGPIVWVSYFHFGDNPYRSGYGLFALPDAVKLGGGLDMGILALRHEQLDVNWRFKSTFTNELPVRMELGIGYHFFP